MTLYLDDPDEGLAPATSHPRFVAFAPEAFYDEGDDFSPFGNDDGHDALRELEDWYRSRAAGDQPVAFLAELIEGWDFGLPEDILQRSDADLLTFVAENDMNEVALTSIARACVAVALGQVKITGVLSPELASLGRDGVRVQRALSADTTRYPNWPHRAEALRALDDLDAALDAAAG